MKVTPRFSTAVRNNLLGPALLVALWMVLARVYPRYIIPSPGAVLTAAPGLMTPALPHHLALTLGRVAVGLGLAFVLGSALGIGAYLLGITDGLNSLMGALQAIPGIILGIILVLALGLGSPVPIALIALMTLPTIAVNTSSGLARRNAGLEEYMHAAGAGKADLVRLLYLPSLVPTVQANLTLGFGLALKVVVLAEFIGAQDGLGYLLNVAALFFDMKEVLFYLCIVLLLTVAFEVLQSLVFRTYFARFFYPD
jgi:NitT/TauT family transport system permease protein